MRKLIGVLVIFLCLCGCSSKEVDSKLESLSEQDYLDKVSKLFAGAYGEIPTSATYKCGAVMLVETPEVSGKFVVDVSIMDVFDSKKHVICDYMTDVSEDVLHYDMYIVGDRCYTFDEESQSYTLIEESSSEVPIFIPKLDISLYRDLSVVETEEIYGVQGQISLSNSPFIEDSVIGDGVIVFTFNPESRFLDKISIQSSGEFMIGDKKITDYKYATVVSDINNTDFELPDGIE